MPECYKCRAKIFFVDILTNENALGKSLPLNVDPDSDRGTVALITVADRWEPGRALIAPVGDEPRHIIGRKVLAEAARMLVSLGGALYRVHFDSCTAPRQQRRR